MQDQRNATASNLVEVSKHVAIDFIDYFITNLIRFVGLLAIKNA